MQLVPSSVGTYPGRQRRTTHSPDRHETSATPGSAEQSVPMGEYAVRGTMHPPPLAQTNTQRVSLLAKTTNNEGATSYSFRDRGRCARTPMRADHRQARRTPPSQAHFLRTSRCRPSSASASCRWEQVLPGRKKLPDWGTTLRFRTGHCRRPKARRTRTSLGCQVGKA